MAGELAGCPKTGAAGELAGCPNNEEPNTGADTCGGAAWLVSSAMLSSILIWSFPGDPIPKPVLAFVIPNAGCGVDKFMLALAEVNE